MGRNKALLETDKIAIVAKGKHKLQSNSDRRAVINLLVENGGVMHVEDINKHFGFDISAVIRALIAAGWLEVAK